MRAGRLDKYIEIQRPTESLDAVGQSVPEWATWVQTWARVEDLAARERQVQAMVAAVGVFKVTMRFIAGVTEQMRIAYAGRVFSINGVMSNERGTELVLTCSEARA